MSGSRSGGLKAAETNKNMDENFTKISGVKVGKRVCRKVLRSTPNLQNEQVQSVGNLVNVARRNNNGDA